MRSSADGSAPSARTWSHDRGRLTQKTPQSDSGGFSRAPAGLTPDTVRTSVSVPLRAVLGPCRTIGPMPEPIVITVDELSADYGWFRGRRHDRPYTRTWSVTMGALVLGRIREYPGRYGSGWIPLVWAHGSWWDPPCNARQYGAVAFLTDHWGLTRDGKITGAPVTVQWGEGCTSYAEHQRVCIRRLI